MTSPMRVVGLLRFACLLAAVLLATPASARTILVIGPHQDDETLIAAGRTRSAVLAGDTVYIALATNGDVNGRTEGLLREAESVAAAQVLGVPEQSVIFLGYGDQTLYDIWASSSGTQVFTSQAGQTATYANRGLGGTDFHTFLTGSPGPYNRDTILSDFKALVTYVRPDEIYTTNYWDNHGDHEGTARFLNEALLALKREGSDVRVRVFQTTVWAPYANGGCYGDWPPAGTGDLPYPPFPPPQCVGPGTPLDWDMIQRFPVPAEMQVPDPAANLKWQALEAYPSQFNDFLSSFVRKDEFFWRFDYGINVSATAQVSASSEYIDGEGAKEHAIDGYEDIDHEWKSLELDGAWIRLDWANPVRIAQVNLYDRLDPADNVLAGTLSFSDGSSIAIGALPTGGKPLPVTFSPRTVTWARFTIDHAEGSTAGLAEFEVLGVSASSASNVPPHVVRGPLPSSTAIDSTQTCTLTVQAHDLDGDPISYTWSVDGGSIAANGPSAVFTPPVVAGDTIFTVTVQVADGKGGVTTNSAFVTVTAAMVNGLAITPAAVASGLTAKGTVTISAPAPSGGLAVPLSSSDTTVASVPASVTIPSGGTSTTFNITTFTVAQSTPVAITASFGGMNRSATLAVNPPIPATLALTPAAVEGGSTTQAVVSLTAAAPPSGDLLHLAVSDASAAGVPDTVSVVGGAASATFAVSTVAVASTRTVTVTASDGSTTVSAVLTVNPLLLSGLSLSPSSLVGGAAAQGTVTLNGPAGASGAMVQLASSDATLAVVPSTVVVAAGASSTSFTVSTVPVAAATPVKVSATFGSTSQTATLTLQPIAISALALSPTSVAGGAASAGTVTLAGPAPVGGLSVALSSNKPAVASVPSLVVVAAGAATASFQVTTYPVSAATSATISASLGTVTKSAVLSIQALTVSSLKLSPTSVIGGSPSTATLTMNGAVPAPGVQVALASNNVGAASVPSTVTVPSGATAVTFLVASVPVAAGTSSVISATYGATKTATLTVKVAALSSLSLAPASVLGGATSTAAVGLTGPAPQGGFAFSVTSSNTAAASVPATVTVPAGATSTTFTVTTYAVSALASPKISISTGTTTKSATLSVTAKPAVSAIALAPAGISSGGTALATVTLNAPAGQGGTVVTVKSSNTAVATVPAAITVPEGAAGGTFNVTGGTVTGSSTASISATAGGVTKNATLTVSP